jgi:hypothetical protein
MQFAHKLLISAALASGFNFLYFGTVVLGDHFKVGAGGIKYFPWGWPFECFFPLANAYHSETLMTVAVKSLFNQLILIALILAGWMLIPSRTPIERKRRSS